MILNTHLPSRYQNHNRPFPTSKVVSYSTPPLIPCFPLLCFLSTSKRDISSTSLYFSISPYTALILLIASHVWAITPDTPAPPSNQQIAYPTTQTIIGEPLPDAKYE